MKADHTKVKHQLQIADGQIQGIIKMVDADAYCLDVSNQLLAVIAVLKRINSQVISAHLASCVKDAKDDADLDEKIAELEKLFKRLSD